MRAYRFPVPILSHPFHPEITDEKLLYYSLYCRELSSLYSICNCLSVNLTHYDHAGYWDNRKIFLNIFTALFFIFSPSLKYLNVSANALETIPPSSQTEESLSTLQELYLTGNNLNENCAALLVGHQNLRVLHVAYNQLLSFPARYHRLCNQQSSLWKTVRMRKIKADFNAYF